jgi:hypothetical protein
VATGPARATSGSVRPGRDVIVAAGCDAAPARALPACACTELTEVSPKRGPVRAPQPAVELERDGRLGCVARERRLHHLLAECPSRPEDRRLDRPDREFERLRDLGVRAALQGVEQCEHPARRTSVPTTFGDTTGRGDSGGIAPPRPSWVSTFAIRSGCASSVAVCPNTIAVCSRIVVVPGRRAPVRRLVFGRRSMCLVRGTPSRVAPFTHVEPDVKPTATSPSCDGVEGGRGLIIEQARPRTESKASSGPWVRTSFSNASERSNGRAYSFSFDPDDRLGED